MSSKVVVYLVFIAFASALGTVECNEEGDILNLWKATLTDPNNVLESWDPTLLNPCTWFHVTCNKNNSVVRVDLGNTGLSGPLVSQLGSLRNLQYLEVYQNKLTGTIPKELGCLKQLRSLGLDHNLLTGYIPSSLGNIKSLRSVYLNSNMLRGSIPNKLIQLTKSGNLVLLNVSDNGLVGTKRPSKSNGGVRITTIIQDPKA